jgi:hypothetical protein
VATAPVPEPSDHDQLPTTVLFTIPAHLGFLATIRSAVGAVVHQVGGSGACRRDLQLATDEAAAVLIEDAQPWTQLQLAITHDDADVYVRVVNQRARPGRRLGIHELTAVLLDGVVESHEVFADGECGYAILQTARNGRNGTR